MSNYRQRLQQLRAFVFAPRRLPGWLALFLSAISFVPDWKSRLDYYVDLYSTHSGVLRMLAPIFTSPLFGFGLLIAGVIYLWFFRGVVHIHHHSATATAQGAATVAAAGSASVKISDEEGTRPNPAPTEFSKLIREREAAWLRKGEPKTPEEELAALAATVREWLLPPNAIRELGSPELNKQLDDLVELGKATRARATEFEEKIQEIRRTAHDYNSVQAAERAIGPWRAKLSDAAYQGDEIRGQIRVIQIELQNQIHWALENGELIAKGFRYPNNEDEIPISSSKWRDMSIDFISYKALRRDGGDVLFTSILIGRPSQNMAPKNVPAVAPTPSTDFTLQGVMERGRRDNLHIRTQEALERARLEAARVADLRAWDRVQGFTLRQAAHLWAEERPSETMERLSQLTEVILNELVDAAVSGALIVEPWPDESDGDRYVRGFMAIDDGKLGIKNSTADRNSYTRVTRANLCAYAKNKREMPAFLFPDIR
jgi:hypothetical protein